MDEIDPLVDQAGLDPVWLAASRLRRRRLDDAVRLSDAALARAPTSQGAWYVMCRALTLKHWVDDGDMDDGVGGLGVCTVARRAARVCCAMHRLCWVCVFSRPKETYTTLQPMSSNNKRTTTSRARCWARRAARPSRQRGQARRSRGPLARRRHHHCQTCGQRRAAACAQ
jgi:hypothetical protein